MALSNDGFRFKVREWDLPINVRRKGCVNEHKKIACHFYENCNMKKLREGGT